ncbi:hypothetical protein PG985_016214 [Apiospora marii]|uniref:Cyanovirin-N domain-containing protein n=1 Tax=Apiospora marii TaxID=335849 RepID=A0ABR1SVJ4_9PEZI
MLVSSIIATTLLSNPALVYGSFTASCQHYDYIGEFDTGLKADCLDNNGNWVHTELDFNSCFANDDGTVVWRKNGNAMYSCLDIGREEDCIRPDVNMFLPECQMVAKLFQCGTRDRPDDDICNQIDINEHIHNRNGQLECFGVLGTRGGSLSVSTKHPQAAMWHDHPYYGDPRAPGPPGGVCRRRSPTERRMGNSTVPGVGRRIASCSPFEPKDRCRP